MEECTFPKGEPEAWAIRLLLRYDPADGKLFWLPRPQECFDTFHAWRMWSGHFENKEAGSIQFRKDNPTEPESIRILFSFEGTKRRRMAHRLIWIFVHGSILREGEIDHKDGNPLNNRITNLRLTDNFGNGRNRRVSRTKVSSQFKGVYPSVQFPGTWVATISTNRKHKYIGRFNSEEDAAKAYDITAIQDHGEFARLNFPKSL